MSWYGSHPVISKTQARLLLPPGACKLTVYLVRWGIGQTIEQLYAIGEQTCTRCGVTYRLTTLRSDAVKKGIIC